jgi:hypothetical protein
MAVKNGTWPPKGLATPTPAASPRTGIRPPNPTPRPPIGLIAPSLISIGGDWVHPGPVGHITMAAVILEGLKADGEVSSTTIDQEGKVVEARGCTISEASLKDGKLTFTRLDDRGPWPVPAEAFPAFKLLPSALDLSKYILRVRGLTEKWYRVSIDGKPAATLRAEDLAAGWNMTQVSSGVLAERVNALTTLLAKLQGPLNNNWRAASKAGDVAGLLAAQRAIDDAEAAIQAAIQPVPLHFEIEKTAAPK